MAAKQDTEQESGVKSDLLRDIVNPIAERKGFILSKQFETITENLRRDPVIEYLGRFTPAQVASDSKLLG